MIKLFQKLPLTQIYMLKSYIEEVAVMRGWVIMSVQIKTY